MIVNFERLFAPLCDVILPNAEQAVEHYERCTIALEEGLKTVKLIWLMRERTLRYYAIANKGEATDLNDYIQKIISKIEVWIKNGDINTKQLSRLSECKRQIKIVGAEATTFQNRYNKTARG